MSGSSRIYRHVITESSAILFPFCLAVVLIAAAAAFPGCSNPPPEEQSPAEPASPQAATPEAPAPSRPAIPSERVTTITDVETPAPLSDEERAAVSGPAQKALEEARAAGAADHASEPFAQGEEAIAAGEKLLAEGKLEEARAQFGKAEVLLSHAKLAAGEAAAETSETPPEDGPAPEEQAALPPGPEEPAPETAPAPAPPVVVMAEPTETVSETPPAEDTEETDAAEAQAAEESRRELERELLEAKQHAQAARQKAFVEPVMQVAQTTLEVADKHLADAAEMESSKPADAKAAYQLAAALYGEALQKAEALALTSQAAANARAAALEVRAQVTDEIRTLAQKETVAGDTAWKAAEDADDAPEQAKALYDLARDEYTEALRVAAERATEPGETSAKAEENLAAAREQAQKARSAITDEIRQYAQQQTAEADALWDLATQSAEHDPVKAAELFQQARAKYDTAAATATTAKRQEFVAQLREQGVVVSPAGGDYATIGEAIADVPAETPIFIKPGIYKEAIVIDKPVALIGDGEMSEIRIESAGADCITLTTTQAVVHGLTLRSTSSFDGKGVYTVFCAEGRLLIEYCDIASDSLSAIAVNGPGTVPTIRGCNIHDSTQAGIFFYDGAQGTVENCEIAGNGLAGIQIKSGANPVVRQCKIRQSKGSGIFVNENGLGTIESCDISQNALAGISIALNGNPAVRDCTIANNRQYGVRVYEGGRGTIENCVLSNNEPETWFVGEDCAVTRQNNRE